ncbi:MAG: hypothetical protein JEZ03_04910 [Bacteroidales bacterium]|nr:hypothetical protein [Bacteroidales bacterium]
MKKQTLIYFFTFMLLISLSQCVKYEEFPPEPRIKLLSFGLAYKIDYQGNIDPTAYNGILQFEFTDGDGNFGTVNNSDTNVFISYYYMLNGELHPYTVYNEETGLYDTINFNGGIDLLPTSENQGYLKGVVWDTLPEIYIPLRDDFDTISLELYIVDEDNNKSNIENTGLLSIGDRN